MTDLKAPEGNTPFEEYRISTVKSVVTGIVLIAIAFAVFYVIPVEPPPDNFLVALAAFGLGETADTFAHESLHYLVLSKLGYDPIYDWPTRVYVPGEHIKTQDMVSALLAPQLLSVLYVVLLIFTSNSVIHLMAGIGLVFNLFGGRGDILWSIKRIRWPEGTRVVLDEEQQTYVSHPSEWRA